jgi:hypothetical protein
MAFHGVVGKEVGASSFSLPGIGAYEAVLSSILA